jgi:hypothetical protein
MELSTVLYHINTPNQTKESVCVDEATTDRRKSSWGKHVSRIVKIQVTRLGEITPNGRLFSLDSF